MKEEKKSMVPTNYITTPNPSCRICIKYPCKYSLPLIDVAKEERECVDFEYEKADKEVSK